MEKKPKNKKKTSFTLSFGTVTLPEARKTIKVSLDDPFTLDVFKAARNVELPRARENVREGTLFAHDYDTSRSGPQCDLFFFDGESWFFFDHRYTNTWVKEDI